MILIGCDSNCNGTCSATGRGKCDYAWNSGYGWSIGANPAASASMYLAFAFATMTNCGHLVATAYESILTFHGDIRPFRLV